MPARSQKRCNWPYNSHPGWIEGSCVISVGSGLPCSALDLFPSLVFQQRGHGPEHAGRQQCSPGTVDLSAMPQQQSQLMARMIRGLTWKAQASNVLPSFPHLQPAQASGLCCPTCVNWLQPIGECSWEQPHEVLLPVSIDKLSFQHFGRSCRQLWWRLGGATLLMLASKASGECWHRQHLHCWSELWQEQRGAYLSPLWQ